MSADIRTYLCNQTLCLIWSDRFGFKVWFGFSLLRYWLYVQTAAFPLCEWQGTMEEGLFRACKANSASLRVKSKPSIRCHGWNQRRPLGLLMSHIRSYVSWEEREVAFTCVTLCFRFAVGSVGGGRRRGRGWHDLWVHFRNSSPTNPQIIN